MNDIWWCFIGAIGLFILVFAIPMIFDRRDTWDVAGQHYDLKKYTYLNKK